MTADLTTTGRITGQPHRIEIWYRRIGDVVWFLAMRYQGLAAGDGLSGWAANGMTIGVRIAS